MTLLDKITHSIIVAALVWLVTFSFLPWPSCIAAGVLIIVFLNMFLRTANAFILINNKTKEVVVLPHPTLIECFSNAALAEMEHRAKQEKQKSNVTSIGETNDTKGTVGTRSNPGSNEQS